MDRVGATGHPRRADQAAEERVRGAGRQPEEPGHQVPQDGADQPGEDHDRVDERLVDQPARDRLRDLDRQERPDQVQAAAAIATAVLGRNAPVAIEVAMAFAVSWKPFVKSKTNAVTTTTTTIRDTYTAVPFGRPDAGTGRGRGTCGLCPEQRAARPNVCGPATDVITPAGWSGPPEGTPPAAGDLTQACAAKTAQTTPRGPVREACVGVERERVQSFGSLAEGLRQAGGWYLWGPYLSERQWGTVREDYSADGEAWSHLPHDHARSRAYRWGEDGLAGFSDVEQRLCLALALWNGRDPILKERIFGLTGGEGNHGEDAKEYWWYLDAVPSHAWNRWRYHYPQRAFPYEHLRTENGRRGKQDPEYELLDTGAFDDDRYWVVEVHYAKAGPDDLLMTVEVTNAGPEADVLHVLPTAWYRNTWSWDGDGVAPDAMAATGADDASRIPHPFLGELELVAGPGPDGTQPELLFCDNETNIESALRPGRARVTRRTASTTTSWRARRP